MTPTEQDTNDFDKLINLALENGIEPGVVYETKAVSTEQPPAIQDMEEREAFEKWIKPKGVELHGAINEWTKKWRYAHSHVDAMWEGFQAGRVVIFDAGKKECPLKGEWNLGRHRADGMILANGTLRIAQPSFDTNPRIEFQREVMEWIVDTLNRATPNREHESADEWMARLQGNNTRNTQPPNTDKNQAENVGRLVERAEKWLSLEDCIAVGHSQPLVRDLLQALQATETNKAGGDE